jgi:hypothetical protein
MSSSKTLHFSGFDPPGSGPPVSAPPTSEQMKPARAKRINIEYTVRRMVTMYRLLETNNRDELVQRSTKQPYVS